MRIHGLHGSGNLHLGINRVAGQSTIAPGTLTTHHHRSMLTAASVRSPRSSIVASGAAAAAAEAPKTQKKVTVATGAPSAKSLVQTLSQGEVVQLQLSNTPQAVYSAALSLANAQLEVGASATLLAFPSLTSKRKTSAPAPVTAAAPATATATAAAPAAAATAASPTATPTTLEVGVVCLSPPVTFTLPEDQTSARLIVGRDVSPTSLARAIVRRLRSTPAAVLKAGGAESLHHVFAAVTEARSRLQEDSGLDCGMKVEVMQASHPAAASSQASLDDQGDGDEADATPRQLRQKQKQRGVAFQITVFRRSLPKPRLEIADFDALEKSDGQEKRTLLVNVMGRLLSSRPEVEVVARRAMQVPFALHAMAGAADLLANQDRGNLLLFLEPSQLQEGAAARGGSMHTDRAIAAADPLVLRATRLQLPRLTTTSLPGPSGTFWHTTERAAFRRALHAQLLNFGYWRVRVASPEAACPLLQLLREAQASVSAQRGTTLALVPELVVEQEEAEGTGEVNGPMLVLHILEYSAAHKAVLRRTPAPPATSASLGPARRAARARQANEVGTPVTAAAVTTRHDASLPSQLDAITKAVVLRNRLASSARVPQSLTVLQPYLDTNQLLSVAVHKNVLPQSDAPAPPAAATAAATATAATSDATASSEAHAAAAAASGEGAGSRALVVSSRTDVTKLAIAVVNEAVRAHAVAASGSDRDSAPSGSTTAFSGANALPMLRAGLGEGLQKAVAAIAMVQAQLRLRTGGLTLVAVPHVVSQQDAQGKRFALVELSLHLSERDAVPGVTAAPPVAGAEPEAHAVPDSDAA